MDDGSGPVVWVAPDPIESLAEQIRNGVFQPEVDRTLVAVTRSGTRQIAGLTRNKCATQLVAYRQLHRSANGVARCVR